MACLVKRRKIILEKTGMHHQRERVETFGEELIPWGCHGSGIDAWGRGVKREPVLDLFSSV
jgi:hypothetical protein